MNQESNGFDQYRIYVLNELKRLNERQEKLSADVAELHTNHATFDQKLPELKEDVAELRDNIKALATKEEVRRLVENVRENTASLKGVGDRMTELLSREREPVIKQIQSELTPRQRATIYAALITGFFGPVIVAIIGLIGIWLQLRAGALP